MSNLCGSVDVVRERERRARLQLLDEYRDPSPQPIFSQPVKVELEDETSRRIKDTLGDFTQVQYVLINDPKHLIGISRTGAAAANAAASSSRHSSDHGGSSSSSAWSSSRNLSGSNHPSSNHHSSNRGVPNTNKRPVPVNGLHKPPTTASVAASTARRPHHPASKQASGGDAKKLNNHHHHHHHSNHPGSSKHHRVVDPPLPAPNANSGSSSTNKNAPPVQEKNLDRSSRDPGGGHQHRDKDHKKIRNGLSPGSNSLSVPPVTLVQNDGGSSSAPSSIRNTPPPPPLSSVSLQTASLPNGVARKRFSDTSNKRTQAKFAIPKLNIPPQEEKSDLSHFEVESILKEMKQAVPPPLTAIQTPRTEERGFPFNCEAKKEGSPFVKANVRDSHAFDRETVPSPVEGLSSWPVKKSPSALSSPFNLQEDLEMSSDSDEEGNMVPSCKNPDLSELALCPKSASNDEVKAPVEISSGTMGEKIKVDGHSSSSESSDSDSEDSCSNDSESSSDSDLEAPTKPQMWALSNFFDETRRNHSPAFGNADNNTNSSIVVKEEPPPSVSADKDGYSLVDEDSNCMLSGKYSDRDGKDYLSPMNDLFMMENGPISLKSEVISPIPSPLTSPVLPPAIPRGPRTPPSPPEEDDEQPIETSKATIEVCPKKSVSKKQPTKSSPKPEICYKQRSEDRRPRSKRKSASRSHGKKSPSPKARPDHTTSREPSASKEQASDASKASAAGRAAHRSPVKSHHKHSGTKRDASLTEPKQKKLISDNKSDSVTKSKSKQAEHQASENASRTSKKTSETSSADGAKAENAEKQDLQNVGGKQRSKDQHKSGHKTKSSSGRNGSSKRKSKSESRQADGKRSSDKKKKSSKFSIKNFLQSPGMVRDLSPVNCKTSPLTIDSPESSPQRDNDDNVFVKSKKDSGFRETKREEKRRKLSSSTSRSRSRSGSRSSKPREHRKRRTSSSGGRKSSLRSSEGKRRHKDQRKSVSSDHNPAECQKSLLLPEQPPPLPQLLSPIPSITVESAIPTVVVSIPLKRLLRIPGQHSSKPQKASEGVPPPPPKDALDSLSVPCSDRPQSTSVSPSVKKDLKAKHRTDAAKSATSSGSESYSEKGPKASKQDNTVSKSASPSVTEKSSIESSGPSKTAEGQSKKRKSDKMELDHAKKKAKMSSSQVSPKSSSELLQTKLKEKIPVVKLEKCDYPAMEKRSTPKWSERRDSTSSLSSLCSQQSHKSSKASKEKTKDISKDSQEAKKPKAAKPGVPLKTKEIKKEIEDKLKVSIKKEPGILVRPEKLKSRKDKVLNKAMVNECKKIPVASPPLSSNTSSQINYWDGLCKVDDTKAESNSLQQLPIVDYVNSHQDVGSDWERFAPDIQQELKGIPNHLNKVNVPGPMSYYFAEGKKLKYLAAKEIDPIQQALKYFEATVMFVLTSLHRELSNKDPDSIYQMYKETLRFTHVIRSCIQKHQSHNMPGNIDFKILILCLKCQSLLHLKLYSLKIKEVKEQHKGVTDFMHSSTSSRLGPHSSPQPASSVSRNLSQPSPCQPRLGGPPGSVPSPHSPTPSPAGSVASVGSQSSGYSSSEVNNGNPPRPHSSLQLPHLPHNTAVSVPQNMFDVMARHHTHLSNLHLCHELWEQADMYMTRSNSRDFFREIAEKSERLSLHSNIKDLVSYLQTGLSLLKDC